MLRDDIRFISLGWKLKDPSLCADPRVWICSRSMDSIQPVLIGI